MPVFKDTLNLRQHTCPSLQGSAQHLFFQTHRNSDSCLSLSSSCLFFDLVSNQQVIANR